MKLKDIKDIMDSKLVDIAEGMTTTGFIFKRKDGTLHGFRCPTNMIELKDFTIRSKPQTHSHIKSQVKYNNLDDMEKDVIRRFGFVPNHKLTPTLC